MDLRSLSLVNLWQRVGYRGCAGVGRRTVAQAMVQIRRAVPLTGHEASRPPTAELERIAELIGHLKSILVSGAESHKRRHRRHP